MSIEPTPNGFHEWRDYVKGIPGLGFGTDRAEACLAHYHAGGFAGWFGTPGFGFHQEDLNFLRQTPDAQWLWFWEVKIADLDALYELTDLQHMGIHPKRPGIDFSRLPPLKSVVNHWNKKDSGIPSSSIAEYYLWHYNPGFKTFEGLDMPRGVK